MSRSIQHLVATCGFRAGSWEQALREKVGSSRGRGHYRKGGRQEGQRDKLSCDAVTSEAAACPQDSSGAMSQTKTRSHSISSLRTQAAPGEGDNLRKGPLLPPKAIAREAQLPGNGSQH